MTSEVPSVAVIGLGALGLVAVKNLAEEEFNVVGFEKNPWVDGLWHFTEEDKTSVLPSTIINISKERGCYTDFPFPHATPSHCTSSDVQTYLEAYVEQFNLTPRLRLGTTVKLVTRDDANHRWEVQIEGSDSQYFDKVVMATGICQQPVIPNLIDGQKFQGEAIHSQSFKNPANFQGKKVLVVGMGNTGADTVEELRGHAAEIYLSHRRGAYVIPRILKGGPFDHTMSLRRASIGAWLSAKLPAVGEFVMNKALQKMQNTAFTILPQWRVSPAPSIKHGVPVISDNLINNLASGEVKSVEGITKAVGPREIELDDGSHVEVDAIIWCTGYKSHFGLLDPAADPTRNTTPLWATLPGSKGKPLPRLYRNVISLDYPESLAFMGCAVFATGAFPLYDLASMAVAQIWKGKSTLPCADEMSRSVDEQHGFICGIARTGSVIPGSVREKEWLAWANEAAGTGVNEHLGWGPKGWVFWLRDRQFCNLLMDGIFTPHIYRVFDEGKRKAWEGAREEIQRVNRSVAEKKKKQQ